MSLDVYLEGEEETVACHCMDCGNDHTRLQCEEYYRANITHNLGTMAEAAGIYQHLWRPDEIGVTRAEQLIEPLSEGLAALRMRPEHFRTFDPPNKWGDYDGLVRFVEEYLAACREHPQARVRVSR